MILQVYSVFDNKAAAYLTPSFFTNDAIAIRALQMAMRDEAHLFSAHPGDFVLYHIGQFDDATAFIEMKEAIPVATVSDILAQMEEG